MCNIAVAPLVGAWIEIKIAGYGTPQYPSLLSWERGLKLKIQTFSVNWCAVAPLVGAWIEIKKEAEEMLGLKVAPLVGAWIEIHLQRTQRQH